MSAPAQLTQPAQRGRRGAWSLARGGRLAVGCAVFGVFLAFDLYWIARRLPHALQDDEWRYLYYAQNLLQGYFSPRDRVFLWNGPGYPLLIAPFAKLGWLDGARYANAVWHAGALAYAWWTLSARLRPGWAVAGVAGLGLYAPVYKFLPMAHTEVFCFFLVAAWIEHSLRAAASPGQRLVAGALLALLCLTKVVFGVVSLSLLGVGLLLWWRCRRAGAALRAGLQQAALALLLCTPWLAYTHDLTGRFLYWSSVGPNSFYWLSAPHAGEWGDWYHHGWVDRDPLLRAHHKALLDQLDGTARDPTISSQERVFNMSTPEAGDVFMREGLRNLREHPLAFARNWCGNVLRLFFDVPTSVRGTRWWNRYTKAHLPLLVWTSLAAALLWRRRCRLPAEWLPLAGFLAASLAVYSFTSACARYLIPLLPLWWLGSCCWLAASAPSQRQHTR